MKMVALLVSAAFVTLAVFGWFGMNMQSANGHRTCVAALSRAAGDCVSDTASGVDAASFHVKAFQSFSLAVLSVGLFVLAVFVTLSTRQPLLQALPILGRFEPARAAEICEQAQKRLRHWLAMHEKRDK